MLFATPTKSGTGILLQGDYYDLSQLYETIHRLAGHYEAVRFNEAIGTHLLGLAYEVRKAKDGHREKDEMAVAGTYFGFQYPWPEIIVQLVLLRQSLKWHPGRDVDYGVLYLLEGQVKNALEAYDPVGSVGLLHLLENGLHVETPYLSHLDARVVLAFLGQKPGKARFRALATLMSSYWSPVRAGYQETVAAVEAAAKKYQCTIDKISTGDWPEDIVW